MNGKVDAVLQRINTFGTRQQGLYLLIYYQSNIYIYIILTRLRAS